MATRPLPLPPLLLQLRPPLSRRVPAARPARPAGVAASTRRLAVMLGNNSTLQQMHPVQKILKAATKTAKKAMNSLKKLAKTRKASKSRKGGYKYF